MRPERAGRSPRGVDAPVRWHCHRRERDAAATVRVRERAFPARPGPPPGPRASPHAALPSPVPVRRLGARAGPPAGRARLGLTAFVRRLTVRSFARIRTQEFYLIGLDSRLLDRRDSMLPPGRPANPAGTPPIPESSTPGGAHGTQSSRLA